MHYISNLINFIKNPKLSINLQNYLKILLFKNIKTQFKN